MCLFAYGQTGSGKTWTMQGHPSGAGDDAGIIPRAVELVFERAARIVSGLVAHGAEVVNSTILRLFARNVALPKFDSTLFRQAMLTAGAAGQSIMHYTYTYYLRTSADVRACARTS